MGWLDFLKPKQVKESTAAPSKTAVRREAIGKLKESLDSWEMFDFLRDRYYGNGQWYFPIGGLPAVGGTTNKIQGRNQYVFYTEQDLRFQRDAARILYASEPVAKAIEANLNAFVIGKGMKYKLCLKKGFESKATEEQLQEYQQLMDAWMDEEQWPEREQECFTSKVVDGEFFLRVVKSGGRVRTIRIEPEHIQNPEGVTFEDGWWLGVKYDPKDYETPIAYGYKLYGQAWEEIKAEEIIHFKSNVSRNVSRGVSDFYPILDDLDSIAKLSDNMRAGATAQAEIAYMMSVENATPNSINAFADEQAEVALTNPVTGMEDKSRRSKPGSVKYHGDNVKFTTMPQGASQGYIEVYQNSMRIVASVFSMPEYMLTSDASNANYSSTLVAGTPFYRAVEKLQNLLKRPFKQVMMRVLDSLYAESAIPTELRAYLDIDVTCDSPVVVDPYQDAQRRDIEVRNGVLSPQMWAMEQGRDPQKVQQQIDEWRDANMEAVQAQQGIFPPDQQPQEKPAVKESWDESKHPRVEAGSSHGGEFAGKGGEHASKTPAEYKKHLTGKLEQHLASGGSLPIASMTKPRSISGAGAIRLTDNGEVQSIEGRGKSQKFVTLTDQQLDFMAKHIGEMSTVDHWMEWQKTDAGKAHYAKKDAEREAEAQARQARLDSEEERASLPKHMITAKEYDELHPREERYTDDRGVQEFPKAKAKKILAELPDEMDWEAMPNGHKGAYIIYHRPSHESIVKKALASGESVPPEVLADYPHLKH